MKSRKAVASLAALAAAALILAGCSSSGSSSSASTGSTASPASAAGSLQAKAEKIAASYEKVPTVFPGGTTSYDPGHGKAEVISCGFAVSSCTQAAYWANDALHAMGWSSPPVLNGALSASTEAGFMEQAAQEHLDGVILLGLDVNTFPAAVEAASAAGVRIVCVVCNSGAKWKGKVVDVGPNWVQAGQEAAWEAMALSGDQTKLLNFNDAEFAAVQLEAEGVKQAITANCPTCTLNTLEVTGAEMAEPGPPPWISYLQSHPAGAVTGAIGEYDGSSLVMAQTDVSDGRNIPLGGYDGDPDALTAIQKGTMTWTIGHPYDYEAWTGADVLGRWTAHQAIPSGLLTMPVVLITKANVDQFTAGNPKGATYPAPAGNWQATFLKMWGKTS